MKKTDRHADKNNSIPAGAKEILGVIEASEILGISQATLRNWVRLEKIKPLSSSPITFTREGIYELSEELENSQLLKRRRNKSRVNSNFIPRSYIDPSSPNHEGILSLLRDVFAMLNEIPGDDDEKCSVILTYVICHYADSFLKNSRVSGDVISALLNSFHSCISDSHVKEITENLCQKHPLQFKDGEDTLGMLYLSLRKIREKKSTGSYYTPYFVARLLIDGFKSKSGLSEKKICDPSCGTGNFLLLLPFEMPIENIYGYDIDPIAVFITRINLAVKYSISTENELKILNNNIRVCDFLFQEPPLNDRFDIVLGNPPWGYHFSQDECKRLRSVFASASDNKMPESFSLFIERGIRALKRSGELFFLLPQTLLEASSHGTIRSFILDNANVSSITYLGDIFYKVQCPSVILHITKKNATIDGQKVSVTFGRYSESTFVLEKEFYVSPSRLQKASFQILSDDEEYALLKKIKSCDHFTLKGNADFALGIVTGSNKTLLKDMKLPGTEPVIKGKDIDKYHLRSPSSFILYEPHRFQQCAPERFYRAKEKLFYRFIADEPVFARDQDGMLSLNSANILIPKVDGYEATYILALLNSAVLSFYYRKNFKSLKVLRSSLESLPIARCSKEMQRKIISLVEVAEKETDNSAINGLDREIALLYGIGDEEYRIIQQF